MRRNAPKEVQAEYPGEINLGNITLSCFVTEQGERFISGRSMTTAIGMKGRGQGATRLYEGSFPQRMLPTDLYEKLQTPTIIYGASSIQPAKGYPAEILSELCDAILEARKNNLLKTNTEKRYAEHAELLVRGFARVGLDALIDEATGYQEIRSKRALAKILETFLAKEKMAWTKTFPDEFYTEIFRLRGWKYSAIEKRPGIIGKWTNDFVYKRLAPGVLQELQKKNPINKHGNRPSKHHQWLTPEYGHPKLREHISGVLALMRAASSWGSFKRMLKKSYPKTEEQLDLPIDLDA